VSVTALVGPVVAPVTTAAASPQSGGAVAIQSFYQAGDFGFWIDPSDLSSMWQDSAGTTPVTAVEQPVGKILDKSGDGAHGTQSVAGNRPILCARLNQLTKSEQLDDATWGKTGCTVTANTVGTLDKIVEDATTGAHRLTGPGITASAGMATVASFRVKPAERTKCRITFSNTTPWAGDVAPIADYDLVAGTVTSATGGTATITALGDGTFRITFAVVNDSGGSIAIRLVLLDASGAGSYTGDNVSGLHAGEAQWELGTAFTRYQSIDTATVYDAAGFPLYLRFDSGGMWLNFTAGGAFTSGTIAHVSLVENAAPFTVYGPNTVNTATNVGFGVADDSVTPSVQAVSGNGTTLVVANAASIPIMPHVMLATADGVNERIRLNLGAAVSQAAATNFNGTSWRLGRTLNDAGILVGRCYGAATISRVLSATQEDQLIRALGRKAPSTGL